MTPDSTRTDTSRNHGSQTEDGPRIYFACLAAYNNGRLHGRWIDVHQDPDSLQAEINEMLAASPIPMAEEWAIHDYEGFKGVRIEKFSGIERVADLAAFVIEHGELCGKLLQHFGGNLDDARAAFNEYAGEHRSLADFAQDLTEETTKIPENLANYIDYQAIACDMELNGDVFTIELGFECVHIFWSR